MPAAQSLGSFDFGEPEVEVAVAEEGELHLSDFVMEEDEEMCVAAGIPVSGPSTVLNSVDIQQRIESALSYFQASNVTIKVCVITNNHGSVKGEFRYNLQ